MPCACGAPTNPKIITRLLTAREPTGVFVSLCHLLQVLLRVFLFPTSILNIFNSLILIFLRYALWYFGTINCRRLQISPRTRPPLILSIADTLKATLRCRANNRRIPYKYIFLFVNKKACAAAKYAMNGAIGSETRKRKEKKSYGL